MTHIICAEARCEKVSTLTMAIGTMTARAKMSEKLADLARKSLTVS
jgi:hypothetical protein